MSESPSGSTTTAVVGSLDIEPKFDSEQKTAGEYCTSYVAGQRRSGLKMHQAPVTSASRHIAEKAGQRLIEPERQIAENSDCKI